MEATAPLAGPRARLDIDIGIPLVVDLDQTLVLTDTLHEGFARLIFSEPRAALPSLLSLLQGRAAFKVAIADQCAPDAACLPKTTTM